MTTAYFLTGSYNDQDNDFELKITVTKNHVKGLAGPYQTILRDLAKSGSQIWETSQPTFVKCLEAMDDFLSANFIVFYSKILTSVERDPIIDKELEGYILKQLEY